MEKPGSFFHPLLATLITGAARLLLTTVERLSLDAGLDWALCDTDSMAIAKPDGMDHETFVKECLKVAGWFDSLNPYETKGPLFKVEDVNYGVGSKDLAPLYCYAISSKRYALFNLDANGEPILRKASAHGLGDKRAPYDEDHAPTSIPNPIVKLSDIGVDRWQYDLWYQIIKAALAGQLRRRAARLPSSPSIAGNEPICGDDAGYPELVQDLQCRSAIRRAGEAIQFPVGVSRDVLLRSFFHRGD